jgi:predicted enzyme related to lactoylglutathione lyase
VSGAIGSIGWIDLTVPDAPALRNFYAAVAGWTPSGVKMGDYSDFVMSTADGVPVTGVCHKRGENALLPSQWLIYIRVTDLDHSVAECRSRGGTVLQETKAMGSHGRYCVIRDPAGAVCALLQPPA